MEACVYLEALDSAFEEHEEGGVRVDSLPLFQDGFGLRKARLCVGAIQGEERLHYRVVPQEGQAERQAQTLSKQVVENKSANLKQF